MFMPTENTIFPSFVCHSILGTRKFSSNGHSPSRSVDSTEPQPLAPEQDVIVSTSHDNTRFINYILTTIAFIPDRNNIPPPMNDN